MISVEKINWDNWPPWLRGLFYFWPVIIGLHLGIFFLGMYYWGASFEGSLSDMSVLEIYLLVMIVVLTCVWVGKIFAIAVGWIYQKEEAPARKVRREKTSTATGAGTKTRRKMKSASEKTTKLKKTEKREYLNADAGEDIVVEEGSEVVFDGSKTMSSEGVSKFEWDFDDGQTGRGETTSHLYEEPGEYHATLKVTDKTGKTSKDKVNIIVEEEEEEITSPPEADAGENRTVKVGEEVEFDASGSTDEVGIVRYIWYFGDWKTGYGEKATHTFDEPGSYSVRLIVSNDGGYSDQDIVEIEVEEEVEEEIEGGEEVVEEAEGLAPEEKFIQAVKKVPEIDEAKAEELYGSGYHDLEDIIIEDTDILSEVLGISESLADEIKAMARQEALSTGSREEEVSPPTAVAGEDRTVKVGEEVGFEGTESKDKIGIERYEWDFDDGETTEGMLVTHAYDEVGDYLPTLKVTNESGLTDEDTVKIKVEEKEVEELSEEEMLKSLKKVKGIGSSTAEQIYDNGFTNYEKIVEASIDELTDVPNVTETRAENLKNVAKREAYEPPRADAGENRNGVVGEKVELDAFRSRDELGIESYEWDFGDGKTDTGLLVSHVYEEPGTYSVTLKVINEVGLSDETTLEVEIEEKEEEVSREEFLEVLQDVRGIGSATAEKIYERGFTGFEKIKEAERDDLTNVPNVTEAKAERLRKLALEQLYEPPEAKINDIENAVVDEEIEFDGSGSEPKDEIKSYSWDFGDGSSAEGESVLHSYQRSGTYQVTLQVKSEVGLTDEETLDVEIEKKEEKKKENKEDIEYSREEFIDSLTEVKGIGPSTAESIYEEGFTRFQKIIDAEIEDLEKVPNITEKRAKKLKSKAKMELGFRE